MIDIVRSHVGQERRISIKGHAEYNPGNDIVCAAVSALAQTLVQNLTDIGADVKGRVEPGDFEIVSSDSNPLVRFAFDMTMTGLKMIANTHPKHVNVTYK